MESNWLRNELGDRRTLPCLPRWTWGRKWRAVSIAPREATCAVVVTVLSWITASHAAAGPRLTSADYARAERFLPWNAAKYTANADIQHHWIGKLDRFWYVRTGIDGTREFLVVDAATGRRTSAFDQTGIAASLAAILREPVSSESLPFGTFDYADGGGSIRIQVRGLHYKCQRVGSKCQSESQITRPGEVASPDGTMAVFRKDDNLWVRKIATGESYALTHDGVPHDAYAIESEDSTHAVTDLRFREPVPPQVRWSPDSRRVLTYQLDERAVKELYLLQSTPQDGTFRPKLFSYHYSLPGDERIATARLTVIDVGSGNAVPIHAASLLAYGDESLFKIRYAWWADSGRSLYFLRRDRFAKGISLNVANADTGDVREILRETSSTPVRLSDEGSGGSGNGVQSHPAVRILKNGDVIWWSERDGWGHLYLFGGATGELRSQITKGQWVVSDVLRVDESAGRIYFLARGREPGRDPYEQHVYSIRIDGSDIRLLSPADAEHSLDMLPVDPAENGGPPASGELDRFSPSGRFFVDSYSRPDKPPVLELRTADGRLVKQLETADVSKLRADGLASIEPFRVFAADGKTAIYGNLYRPSSFDPAKKYPVIDADYPGPFNSRVAKSFSAATFDKFGAQSLAELGFFVVTIDGRGTAHRSRDFLTYSYGHLYKASDLEDHVSGIRQLAERYPQMDLARVGIVGVSGGGFAAARGILRYPKFYKVAVSAEGSHDQRGEVASWGEAYVGPPATSDFADDDNVPLAGHLEGKLLLMHGEMDDNVPPALTLKLVDALIKANKDFDLLIIPNGNHGIYTSPYFIRRCWDYFVMNLMGAEPPENYLISQPRWMAVLTGNAAP